MHQTRGRCGQSIILTLRVSVLRRGAQAWPAYRCAAGFLSGLSRLWVISGGDGREDVAFHVRFTPESYIERHDGHVRFVPKAESCSAAKTQAWPALFAPLNFGSGNPL